MLHGFEQITADLNEYERHVLLPIMAKCLERKNGKEKAVTNREMCEKMAENGYEISDTRVRKIINYIRVMDLVPCLIATAKGYYVSKDEREIKRYIASLNDRAAAIMAVADSLTRQLNGLNTDYDC